jgi:hypothetical protein
MLCCFMLCCGVLCRGLGTTLAPLMLSEALFELLEHRAEYLLATQQQVCW